MTAALEDVKTLELEQWLTLNTASSPTKLKQGQSPNMENMWVDEKPGSVITANGFIKVGSVPSGNPCSFCIDYFKTSSGAQVFVVSDNATVWTTLDFQTFTSIITGLSSSFQLRGMVIRDKLWLTNGSDSVRTYDGTSVTVLDGGGITPNVPKGRYIGFHDERVWMYHLPTDRSAVRFTALVDNTGAIITPDDADAWPTDNQLQISEGDADFGTGLILYRGYLYAFKQYGIYRIVGYDEYTYSRVKTRASTGSRFNESLQIKDNLVHLIGVDGIYVFDGEDAQRISDIIDPASASQTAFGFNQLQQPNTNNQFFETTDTSDWNAGTVPTNLDVDDSIVLVAADDTGPDFASGNTLTNVEGSSASGGFLGLTLGTTGVSTTNGASGKSGTLTAISGAAPVGSESFITDGNLTNRVGFAGGPFVGSGAINVIGLGPGTNFTTLKLRGVISGACTITFHTDLATLTPSFTDYGLISGSSIGFTDTPTETNVTITFPSFNCSSISVVITWVANTGFTVTELQLFTAAYHTTGQFISKSLDLGVAPSSFGNFNIDLTLNGQTSPAFYTQSSNDGSSWDAAVAVTNGGPVGSTVRRYLRWRADFVSTGSTSPTIEAVYLMSQYVSAIHDTGGSIFAWGPLESDYALAGQTVNFYYRTATTSGGVSAASWNTIVPGGVISSSVLNQFVQFKIEILSGTATGLPTITSVTINWVVGTGTQPNTLQNVASYIWRNRYWLAAAGPGATSNDLILVRGKKTAEFDSPWQLKDWPIISFTRFHDDFYGCSSVDGSIYKLDTGYSKNGSDMDAFFETGDFVFGGLYATLKEILIEVERTGPYDLSVGVSIDQGATWEERDVDLTVSTFAQTYIKRLNFDVSSDRLRFRMRINGTDQPFQVHRLIAFYTISQSRGSVR